MLVDVQLPLSWINVTFAILEVICSITLMVIATPAVAACIPVIGAVCFCIQNIYLRTSRQVRLMDLEAKAPLCTQFLETLAGVITIRAFGWASSYRKRNDVLLDKSQVPFYLLATVQNWLVLVLELMTAGLVTLVIGIAVSIRSEVDPGFLGLALVSAMDIGLTFRLLITYWTDFEISLSAVGRIREFATTPSEQQTINASDLPEQWPRNSVVTFKGFSASYSEGGKLALNNVNLRIEAGEKIGLCGRTGSGKSSLVAALFGLLHHKEGQILLDGISITDFSLSILRSNLIALPQEPFFLKGTVRYNLAPWAPEENRPSVSDEQMEVALQQVQLFDKLNNVVEEGQYALDLDLDKVETLLSQGERQLFCLARAILMDAKIVVLDEATSR
jgi:ATP-binding cassette subfamily C (CFTR/MRP) protein 1